MKFKKILLNLAVALAALLFGLAWVGIYQFFVEKKAEPKQETILFQDIGKVTFDINDPESVLPIDFEEDKLSDPKEDENNPRYFDSEGYYFFDEYTEGFDDFFYISIHNKNFGTSRQNLEYGQLTAAPNGHIILQDGDKPKYIDFEYIKIADSELDFRTKTVDGISYEFDGEYLVKGNFYTLNENAKVLKGTLVKKKNGKTVAEDQFSFNWKLEIECLR